MADDMLLLICRRCRKGIILMTRLGESCASRGTDAGREAFVEQHWIECWDRVDNFFQIAFETGSEADLGHGVTLEAVKAKEII